MQSQNPLPGRLGGKKAEGKLRRRQGYGVGEGWNLSEGQRGAPPEAMLPIPRPGAPPLFSPRFPSLPSSGCHVPGLHNPSRGDRVDTRRAEAGGGRGGRDLMGVLPSPAPSFSGSPQPGVSVFGTTSDPGIPERRTLPIPLRGPVCLPIPGSPPQQEGIRSLCASGRCFAIASIVPGRLCHPQVRRSAQR